MKAIASLLLISSLSYAENSLNTPVESQEIKPVLLENNKLWFVGDSTLHSYIVNAEHFSAKTLVVVPKKKVRKFKIRDLLITDFLKTFEVKVPVKDLKADSESLNDNMYEALKSKNCPNIEFTMESYKPIKYENLDYPTSMSVSGKLSVACVTQTIELVLKSEIEDDVLHLSGNKELKMTDFKIDPPAIFFNTIKTDDEIKVYFDISLKMP